MPHRFECAAAVIVLLSATAPCAAQSPQTAPTTGPQARDPKSCSSEQQLRADATAPQPSGSGDQNLSEKLARTDGVLCPPNIDPEIKAPTPQGGGKMPVIPPPGSPGGDPTVRPK